MTRILYAFLFALAFCMTGPTTSLQGQDAKQLADKVLGLSKVRGGLVVHLGCGDGKLTHALRLNERYQVQGLDRDENKVAAARRLFRSSGVNGQVTAEVLRGERLPYIDNLVNLVVVESSLNVSSKEVMRVLAPGGVALERDGDDWKKQVKLRPDNLDEWTHYMHDASGNAVAHDDVVGPPRHLQWIGSPRWSRHHDRMASLSAMVSSGGRMFYIMDEGSRVSIQMPPKWTLIARDAFNGVILWKRPLKNWHNHLWPLKSGPTQLARRLVALGDRVYVTLGLNAPLTALDAATGETVREYKESKATEELILRDGVLFLLVNKGKLQLSKFAPTKNTGDQAVVARQWSWNEEPRTLMAIKADTGKVLWERESTVAPLSLSSLGKRVLFHDGEKVVCLDRDKGEPVWSSEPASRRAKVTFNFGPKLVIYDDVVLFAGGDRKMKAFSGETGETLWSAPHPQSGYLSPEDLLVAGGLVWSAPTTRTQDSGAFKGRDPKTGEVKAEFSPNVDTYWFHHRCYMAKATDKFLMPSRTGVEFVNFDKQDWDIHHWVRGGCLYGIMPCNGLIYAPPHDCACYPETKLYGLNALAPRTPSRVTPRDVPDAGRLLRGPAFGQPIAAADASDDDWPTYRHDRARSGYTASTVPAELSLHWTKELGGKLSTLTVAGGKVFVAQVDAHTVHALNTQGDPEWSYTVGGRVDSPPTYDHGRLLFGSADGWVYCLRAEDGQLIWRFRAAPEDRRLMSMEQLESVWPVHGSVLAQDGHAFFVAGRSNFLDGGLRMLRLDIATGRKISETIIDERLPDSDKQVQSKIQVLQMPAGLPDILSSDGRHIYMRSQRFKVSGSREAIGPNSGNAAEQGAAQSGEGMHLFSPTGFMDDSYFHRAYWVYGRSFAGGHNGYYQAAKYAPAGRLLVHDQDSVYGFGRKAEYLKWTTVLEHQLFATSKTPPEVPSQTRESSASVVRFKNSPSLNPANKPLAVEAWVKAERPDGVIVARGGPAQGFALILRGGRPRFVVRADSELHVVTAKTNVIGAWTHLVGVLGSDEQLRLYVNGRLLVEGKGAFLTSDPKQTMEMGVDEKGSVGEYPKTMAFGGAIDELRIYHGAVSDGDVATLYANPEQAKLTAKTVLSLSFDDGKASDASGHKNHGEVSKAKPVEGRLGMALRFVPRPGKGGGSFVKHRWRTDTPLLARAMVLANKTLFVAGPPDLIDEAETFQKLTDRDPKVHALLKKQDEALNGKQGGLLRAVSAATGETLGELKLPSIPVWDGMVAAGGRLYLTTTDGKLICLQGK